MATTTSSTSTSKCSRPGCDHTRFPPNFTFSVHSKFNFFSFSFQPANSARDKRMGRVSRPADQSRLRVDGQPGVYGNNGEVPQDCRLHSDIRLGAVRRRHLKRFASAGLAFYLLELIWICFLVYPGCVLFMSAQLKRDRKIQYCNKDLARDKQFIAIIPEEERVAWMWALMIAFAVPEIGALIRSARICFFKSWKLPRKSHFLFIFLMETLHASGLVLLVFVVLPEIDSVKGAMLTNCLCLVPGVFGLLSRTSKEGKRAAKVLVDLAAIAAQVTGFVVWPLLEDRPVLWMIPVSAFMVSCGWWENYVSPQSPFSMIRSLGRIKEDLRYTRYFACMFLSIWKVRMTQLVASTFLHTIVFSDFGLSPHSHFNSLVRGRRSRQHLQSL
jgi:hypothetical protein